MIWNQKDLNVTTLNQMSRQGLAEHLGIEFIEIGENYLIAKMPVKKETRQPFGILHGGASVVLAETLGSVASILCLENILKQTAVGLEINANHLKSIKEGFVFGRVSPVKIGRNIHVWQISIVDKMENPICFSRLTVMIRDIK